MDLTLVYLLLWAAFLLLVGYFLPRVKPLPRARLLAWTGVVLPVIFAEQITLQESALYRMGAIVCLLLFSYR